MVDIAIVRDEFFEKKELTSWGDLGEEPNNEVVLDLVSDAEYEDFFP